MDPKVAGESPSAEEKTVSAKSTPLFDTDFDKDGDVIVLVENTLYSIPSFLLKKSELFRSMFTLNPGPDDGVDGLTAERPINMSEADPSLKQTDFKPFLLALCAPMFKPRKFSADELKSILYLAHKWQFSDLETYAVDKITKLTPVLRTHELLELGAKYSIDDLLLAGYLDVCCRAAVPCHRIHSAIVTHLSVQTFLDLLRARRKVWEHLRAIPAKNADANVYVDCFKAPIHCHSLLTFKYALNDIFDSEKTADSKTDTSTFLEHFETALKSRTAMCKHCSTCILARARSYIEEPTIKAIVRSTMMRGTLTKEDVGACGA